MFIGGHEIRASLPYRIAGGGLKIINIDRSVFGDGSGTRALRGQGDNLFADTILAVRGATGKLVWYYQEVPGDDWDFDSVSDLMLADLTVDGTVELERLNDVIFVGRPAFGQTQSTVSMFKLEDGGKGAVRVTVKLGRSSVNTIEVIEGLQPGDQVILSDTSTYDSYNQIRLN